MTQSTGGLNWITYSPSHTRLLSSGDWKFDWVLVPLLHSGLGCPWPRVPLACLPLLGWSFYCGHCSCVSDRYSVESSVFYHSMKTAWVGPGEMDWLLKALAISRKGLPPFTAPPRDSQLSILPVPGISRPLLTPRTPGTHKVCRQAGRQNTHKHKVNLYKKPACVFTKCFLLKDKVFQPPAQRSFGVCLEHWRHHRTGEHAIEEGGSFLLAVLACLSAFFEGLWECIISANPVWRRMLTYRNLSQVLFSPTGFVFVFKNCQN